MLWLEMSGECRRFTSESSSQVNLLFNSSVPIIFHGVASPCPLPTDSFCSSAACSERLGRLWSLGVESMLVTLLLQFLPNFQREGLWHFSPLPGGCNAAAAATLLSDALRCFVLLTADCLGDRYWWVQDGNPHLWREQNLHKYRRKLHLLLC